MAWFEPIMTTSDKLNTIDIVDGHIIFVTDVKKIYLDIDENTRAEMGGLAGVDFLTKLNPEATGSLSLNRDEFGAIGVNSVALGDSNQAIALASVALGEGTVASARAQTVVGRYNIADEEGNYVFIIGNGTDDENRKNLFTIDKKGNIITSGRFIDGNGNSIDDVLNFDTLARMMTSGNNRGISITKGITETGENCFEFLVDGLLEMHVDSSGYWVIDGQRIVDDDGNEVMARGLSAYELAKQHDPSVTTEAEWLASLKGEKGDPGTINYNSNKTDVTCVLYADKWIGGAPYYQQVTVNNITEKMNPRVDILVSDDIAKGIREVNAYNCITKIITGEGFIKAYCYETKPQEDITIMIELFTNTIINEV